MLPILPPAQDPLNFSNLADVQAGLRPIPTFEEVTLEFPTLIW